MAPAFRKNGKIICSPGGYLLRDGMALALDCWLPEKLSMNLGGK